MPVFGEVVAVRGNVLQMRSPFAKGLTRVIIGSNAQIIRDETLKRDVLRPGMKVTGTGLQVAGTGSGATPMKVKVQSLELDGMGGHFMFAFWGGRGPLMRGREPARFQKEKYSGNTTFTAQIKSVSPLVLEDDHGNPLPVILGEDVEVHRRVPRPIKAGDIIAGARLMAMGETGSDGLLNAHMIILFAEGSERGSLIGTITGVGDHRLTVQPRFAPEDLQIEVAPAAKYYSLESLDLDSINVGDTLNFSGKVIGGTASAPTVLVVASNVTV